MNEVQQHIIDEAIGHFVKIARLAECVRHRSGNLTVDAALGGIEDFADWASDALDRVNKS